MQFFIVVYLLIHTPNGYELEKVIKPYQNSFQCRDDADILNKSEMTLSAECFKKELPSI